MGNGEESEAAVLVKGHKQVYEFVRIHLVEGSRRLIREKKAWLMGSVGKEKLQTWPVTIEEGRVKVDL